MYEILKVTLLLTNSFGIPIFVSLHLLSKCLIYFDVRKPTFNLNWLNRTEHNNVVINAIANFSQTPHRSISGTAFFSSIALKVMTSFAATNTHPPSNSCMHAFCDVRLMFATLMIN